MEIRQVRELGRQSLVITRELEKETAETGRTDFREQMLLYNEIDGVMRFDKHTEGTQEICEYSIEALKSVAEICSQKKLSGRFLSDFLEDLLQIVYRGREFMLCEDDFCINSQTVFIDAEGGVHVAYLCGYGGCLREQLRDLAEQLMNCVDYHDEEAVLKIYSFYMSSKEESCTLEELLKIVRQKAGKKQSVSDMSAGRDVSGIQIRDAVKTRDEILPALQQKSPTAVDCDALREDGKGFGKGYGRGYGKENRKKNQSPEEIVYEPTFKETFKQSPLSLKALAGLIPCAALIIVSAVLKSGILVHRITGRNSVTKVFLVVTAAVFLVITAERMLWTSFKRRLMLTFGEALRSAGETTVLLYPENEEGYALSLISEEYPSININRFPFYIGKDETHVDYVLPQVGVSRYHLKIDRKEDIFTVSDLNSTNGTFVNGVRLEPHVPCEIRRGDEIRIGNLIFYCN